MSDHEFEKQVRQKLNQLNIPPSAKAWENIEETLREGRRRTAPVLWVPLVILGLAAGGFLLYRRGTTTSADTQKSLAKTDVQASADKNNNDPLEPKTSSFGNGDSAVNNMPQNNGSTELIAAVPEKKIAGSRGQAGTVVRRIHVQSKKISDNTLKVAAEKNADENIPDIDEALRPFFNRQVSGTDQSQIKKNDVSRHLPPAVGLQIIPERSSVAIPDKRTKKKVSKWAFAITAYSGVSAVNKGNLVDFSKPQVEDVSFSASVIRSTPTVAYGRPSYTPSSIYPGFAFSIGGLFKRDISKRFSLSAGLNYTQFNTLSKVGQRINGSQVVNNGPTGYLYVQNYYLLDEPRISVYRNRYHFVELPVNAHFRLNKNNNLPIYVNGGLVVSQLIQSNSLHFDGTTGVYYKNDRLINQTQMGFTTGVSFVLFPKSAMPLWVGPSARSNISTVLSKDISANKHFVTLGLDLKLFLR